jgi:multisubunit Na+/H+ antiporter MnhB subunit
MKIKRKHLMVVIFLIFLLSGLILFRMINHDIEYESDKTTFQAWFWEKRSLDIAVQIGMVIAGALGIAAILPMEDDHNE